jgi:hypothetical protein
MQTRSKTTSIETQISMQLEKYNECMALSSISLDELQTWTPPNSWIQQNAWAVICMLENVHGNGMQHTHEQTIQIEQIVKKLETKATKLMNSECKKYYKNKDASNINTV